jgi:hypothetical protein
MKDKTRKTSPVVKMTLNKNRTWSFSTTGIIPYFLILVAIVGVGLFSPMGKGINIKT